MVGRLHEKVALVVGAGSVGPGWGNGKAAAVLFAREGAKVLCADVNEDAANETVQIIRQEGGTVNAIRTDVTSHDDIRRMVKACTDLYGRIDVVDYNVGLAHVGGVVELPEEEWDRIFAVNLKGCYLTMKHVIPIMEKQGGGSIINISSVAGIRYNGRTLFHVLRHEGSYDPPDAHHGRAVCAITHPGERGPPRSYEDSNG